MRRGRCVAGTARLLLNRISRKFSNPTTALCGAGNAGAAKLRPTASALHRATAVLCCPAATLCRAAGGRSGSDPERLPAASAVEFARRRSSPRDPRRMSFLRTSRVMRRWPMRRPTSLGLGDTADYPVDPKYLRQVVSYDGGEKPGAIIIDTLNKFLYSRRCAMASAGPVSYGRVSRPSPPSANGRIGGRRLK